MKKLHKEEVGISKPSQFNKQVPRIATMIASGLYLHERHAYLERKVQMGGTLDRCYCGNHLDEKAELARYRRKVLSDKEQETKENKLDRMIAEFEALSADERKRLLCLSEH